MLDEDPGDDSFSNSLTERLRQGNTDFSRPAPELDPLRRGDIDIHVMGIDVTYSNKETKDSQGTVCYR